ncbi:rna polymerase iii transcription factor [Moniliophthora roreri MCA 2997]|uniref:Rna polymerase iii transcription factor n=1 Tax=Moniliophthora roreri (strain MCA 2997) TaxID=1381753 RepID=V2Y537_MONRO|nr:rna polymerase iii transcription factor [Moniliophthora roreri MCA 2997]
MALLFSRLRPTDTFIISTLQKSLFREMKPSDAAANNPDSIRWNLLVIGIHEQICIAAKTYQSAIWSDGLAIAHIGKSMQRQSDHRRHLIAQGLGLLSYYRSLRKDDPRHLSEVEFSFGRTFQRLDLHSLAVKYYERVLEMADKDIGTKDQVRGRILVVVSLFRPKCLDIELGEGSGI